MKQSGRTIEVANNILLGAVKEALREGHSCTINVKGYSMRPFLEHERDRVVVAPITGELRKGDAVLAELCEGHYVLHRIIRVEKGIVTLMGDGNLRGTEQCRKENVCGIVTTYLHPRCSFKAESRRVRTAVRVWQGLLPVRRPLLLIYRIGRKMRVI